MPKVSTVNNQLCNRERYFVQNEKARDTAPRRQAWRCLIAGGIRRDEKGGMVSERGLEPRTN